jgi:cytosine/adenosine deaminase-related metal-dependent hydrolase
MLITADWVLPVEGPPIPSGAVLLRGSKVSAVGPAADYAELRAEPRVDFPGHIVAPGLVDAHTHLSLAALEGVLPPAPFVEWLPRLVSVMSHLDEDDFAASATLGVLQCLQAGITVVGDIAYGPEAPATAADMGLAGVFYWEVLGVPGDHLERSLREAEFPLGPLEGCSGRTRCGISPHSAYTAGPGLLAAVAEFARERGYGVAIHVAESSAELSAVRTGQGPLAEVTGRLAPDFLPTRVGSVTYLARLGVLDDAVAVHCVHLTAGEATKLAEHARGVVVCPRSNAYLRNGSPPVQSLLRAGNTLGLGTDSSASNTRPDLFAEARAVREIDPALDAPDLVRMMTLDGAKVLGLDGRFGSLAPGKQADLVMVKTVVRTTPEEAFLAAGPGDVTAVISGGTWRLRYGKPVMPPDTIESAARNVNEKAQRILRRKD